MVPGRRPGVLWRLVPAKFVLALFPKATLTPVANDCDTPAAAGVGIGWSHPVRIDGIAGREWHLHAVHNQRPGNGPDEGLIRPNRRWRPPHWVFIPPTSVVQDWNNCADAYPS
ncbi:hypothetical protein [Methylobacterium fujisawaense]|jgi:hypothetical protein